MIEVAALLGLLGVAAAVFVVLAVGWLLVKLLFKILLFPLALAAGAIKITLLLVLGVAALFLAPVVLAVGAAVLIPLLLLATVGVGIALVVGLGCAVFAIVT